jgi:hypothetical protein
VLPRPSAVFQRDFSMHTRAAVTAQRAKDQALQDFQVRRFSASKSAENSLQFGVVG